MPRIIISLTAIILLLALSACASNRAKDSLTSNLLDYAAAIRWNEIDVAWAFVAPEFRENNPLSDLERERYKQIQFTNYEVKSTASPGEGRLHRVIELRFINRHTQIERTLRINEHWQWHEDSKRWWLSNGLPDISHSQ